MQIKKLEMAGFKSFMNPVALDFGGGITAILGPNGCGKSNVVDSVRWVLGEQSAKQLRGDKMMNVVFGGTRARKPLSMAEVSVTFSNADGRMAVPFEEVRITRRLSRDGASDYLLNGAPCRLKDIRDLITDTGAGSHAYSIIEREMVDSVISSNEDSRRFLLEEASGIMKYRLRRKEAQRKLDMTATDLTRLSDIIEEIARQVRSLKRQMGRAQRYQEVHEQLTKGETWLASQRLGEYNKEIDQLQAALGELQAVGIGDDSEGDTLRARIEQIRTDMIEVENAFRQAGSVCDEHAGELKTREETLLVLRERIDATREAQGSARGEIDTTQQRQEQVQKDRSTLEARRGELDEQLEVKRQEFTGAKESVAGCEEEYERKRAELFEIKQRSFDFAEDTVTRRGELNVMQSKIDSLKTNAETHQKAARGSSERAARLAEEIAATTKRVELAEKQREDRNDELQTLERRDDELVAALESQREDRAEVRTQLDARRSQGELLESLVEAFEGFGKGAKALLEQHGDHEALLGSLADLLHAPEGLERAFDVLLHEVIDALLVRDLDGALALVGELRNNSLGSASFVYSGPTDHLPDPVAVRQACAHPGFLGLAMDLLPPEGPAQQVLQQVLAHAVVVEDDDAARAILEQTSDPWLRIATRAGVLFTAQGKVYGGSSIEREVSLLGRQRRLRELEQELSDLESLVEDASARCAATESALRACRAERRDAELGLKGDDEALVQLQIARASFETAFEECNGACGRSQGELAAVEEELEALCENIPQLSQDAERRLHESDEQKRQLAEREEGFAKLEREREKVRGESAEIRVALVELRGEVESSARQLDRLGELEKELGDLHGRRTQDIKRAVDDLQRYESELEDVREQAASLAQQLEAARSIHNEIGVKLDAERSGLEAEQSRLAEIEKSRREQEGRVHGTEMKLSECRMRTQNLVERMQENYDLDAAGLLALTFEWSDEEAVPTDETIKEMRHTLSRLGPVNLLALDEYEEKKTRLEFLESQRSDLEQASTSLEATIEKINRTARFLFMETFEQVSGHFRDIIRTVFGGGSGELVLTNPEDPLDSDVEIRVRPRGKKIDTLSQLSSGERTLTAIALLFSIYLVKPSPFCIFDEVDAPLDDANIGRFVNLLQEFQDRTQFIVITHNKLTMEAADRLYGVTMEEEGVSKLVTVALDGEVKGAPKKLKKKVDRVARAAALLQPSEDAIVGAANTDDSTAEDAPASSDSHAAARLEGPKPAARVDKAEDISRVITTDESTLSLVEGPTESSEETTV